MGNLTRKDIVREVATRSKRPMTATKDVIETLAIVLTEHLLKGEGVAIEGLGTFTAVDVKEKTNRTPRTGEPVLTPAHKVPKFKYAKPIIKALKEVRPDE